MPRRTSQANSQKANPKESPKASQEETVDVQEFVVPEGEENTAHVMIEKKTFDRFDGNKTSKPFMQKFQERDWAQFLQYHKAHGYTIVEIKHLPEGFQEFTPEN